MLELVEEALDEVSVSIQEGAEDLLRALIGMCYMHDQPGWQSSVPRLVDVFVDGLARRPTEG